MERDKGRKKRERRRREIKEKRREDKNKEVKGKRIGFWNVTGLKNKDKIKEVLEKGKQMGCDGFCRNIDR